MQIVDVFLERFLRKFKDEIRRVCGTPGPWVAHPDPQGKDHKVDNVGIIGQ